MTTPTGTPHPQHLPRLQADSDACAHDNIELHRHDSILEQSPHQLLALMRMPQAAPCGA